MEGSADLLTMSHRRYGLPEPEAAPEAQPASDEPGVGAPGGGQASGEGRRHLSAHERRLAKKVGGNGRHLNSIPGWPRGVCMLASL